MPIADVERQDRSSAAPQSRAINPQYGAPAINHIDDAGTDLVTAQVARDVGARIAAQIARRVHARDEFVVFQARNSGLLLSGIFGALLSGFAPAIISDALTEGETSELLANVPHSMVISDEVLDEMGAVHRIEALELLDFFSCRPMHFTSGTSGRPKGVWSGRLSREDALALAAEEREVWGFDDTDVHLVCGPLSHSAPLRFALHTIFNGGAVVVPTRFDASVASSLIGRSVVTTTFMAPIHLKRILDVTPSSRCSIRLLACAGAPCPDAVRRGALKRFGTNALVEFYGSTEGSFTICSSEEWREHPGTVGKARPGRQLRVDHDGHVWCRAPAHATFEYWGDPAKTAAAWNGDWFTVGDLGRIDAEGYLYLEGRRSDLIITGGVNVYPAEIERVLSDLDGVTALAAFGQEDPEWGQRVCVAYEGGASVEALREYAIAHLAPAKRPKQIMKLRALPTTFSGKVDRGALLHIDYSDEEP